MKILLLLFLNLNFVIGQNIEILDTVDKTPIPYVNLICYSNNQIIYGNYSDEKGIINIPQNIIVDSMKISCVGYDTKKINEVQKKIYLNKKLTILKEIIIYPKESKKIGYSNEKLTSNFISISKGIEICAFIENSEKKEYKIESILFNVKKTKNNIKYRVHIYKQSNNNLSPGIELTNVNIINEIEKNTKGIIEVNLSEYNIILPLEGVFVSIEGIDGFGNELKSLKEKNEFTLELNVFKTESEIYQFKNHFNTTGWVNYNKWLPENYYTSFKKKYDKTKLYAPAFGLKVSEIINE